jgi:hypothetical protein
MMEAAFVFDKDGSVIFWHLPEDRTSGSIPDSRQLWTDLWNNRDVLGGVAHTHPWDGESWFSHTDVTTFAAIEQGLGVRLIWPVVTFTEIGYFEWMGPGETHYGPVKHRRFRLKPEDIDRLRNASR